MAQFARRRKSGISHGGSARTTRVDLGIVRVVSALRDGGVETYESCEGGPGHAFFEPTVRFHGGLDTGWRALALCLSYGFSVRRLERFWSVYDGHEPNGPEWQIVLRERAL